jgi:hypothetical protein
MSRSETVVLLALGLAACTSVAQPTVEQGTGPDPVLPPAKKELVPTVQVAKATGWPSGPARRSRPTEPA